MITATQQNIQTLFANRIKDVPKSFIREILKIAINPDIISFAGGLPNPSIFPVEEMAAAAKSVFEQAGPESLQYSSTEGFLPLRQHIADQYQKEGLSISANNLLITSGSQQGLDLIAKVFINEGDKVIIEEPGYLGAIQSLSVMGAKFLPTALEEDGLNTEQLEDHLTKHTPKLFYTVPSFQNPSGISYTNQKLKAVGKLLRHKNMVIVEDTPYKEIKFNDQPTPSFYNHNPDQTILLGSFSKTTVPGFRLGWIAAADSIMERLLVAKQAADLHTNNLAQRILMEYLTTFDNTAHVKKINALYGQQRNKMIASIEKYFPKNISYTQPQGGMFLWVTLPKGASSMKLFTHAIKEKVAFVPGTPFYTDGREDSNTLRLNFSNSSEEKIEEGIKRLGKVFANLY